MRRGAAAALVALVIPAVGSAQDTLPPAGRDAALRSFLVPGWGQLHLGQRRGWAYLAAEGLAWTVHLHGRSKGREARHAYRDLAWETARGASAGARVDPDFAYFERLAHWGRSGAFDAAPGRPGVQPEPDPSTFNGMIWGRARDLFLRGEPEPGPDDPGWIDALAYYEERAYGPDLLWDWTDKEADLERYRDLIDESDDAFRRATHAVGAVLANHVLSGMDAWISSRAGAEVNSRVVPFPGPRGAGWTWSVRVAR